MQRISLCIHTNIGLSDDEHNDEHNDERNAGVFDDIISTYRNYFPDNFDRNLQQAVEDVCKKNLTITSSDFLKFIAFIVDTYTRISGNISEIFGCVVLIIPQVHKIIPTSCTSRLMLITERIYRYAPNDQMHDMIRLLLERGAKFSDRSIGIFKSVDYQVTLDWWKNQSVNQALFEYMISCQESMIERITDYIPIMQSIMKKNKVQFNQQCADQLFKHLGLVDGMCITQCIVWFRTNGLELTDGQIIRTFRFIKYPDHLLVLDCLGIPRINSLIFVGVCELYLPAGSGLLATLAKSSQYQKLRLDAGSMQRIAKSCIRYITQC
jgi:hypothetical protein